MSACVRERWHPPSPAQGSRIRPLFCFALVGALTLCSRSPRAASATAGFRQDRPGLGERCEPAPRHARDGAGAPASRGASAAGAGHPDPDSGDTGGGGGDGDPGARRSAAADGSREEVDSLGVRRYRAPERPRSEGI